MSLAVTPCRQLAVDAHQHVLGLALDQRLRGEHMLDFRRADAVRQRAEGAVRRGVAVAADDGHAGQREALLRADDVDDALADVVLGIVFDAEILGVPGQRLDLDAAFLVLDADLRSVEVGTLWSTTASVFSGCAHLAAAQAQAFEGLRAGHFVDEVAVDVEQAGAVVLAVDDVVVANLVVEGARCAHVRKSVDMRMGKSRRRQASVRRGDLDRSA